MFDLFDVDGDGYIGLLDFLKAHLAANLDPRINVLVDHFNRMDENKNQRIERAEYLKRALLFYLSDDPAVPSLFAGD
jgi:hypothetical protein